MAEEAHQDAVLANGALLPDLEGDEDPDELLSDEDAPDLQDEIAKTLTSLKACALRFLLCVIPDRMGCGVCCGQSRVVSVELWVRLRLMSSDCEQSSWKQQWGPQSLGLTLHAQALL